MLLIFFSACTPYAGGQFKIKLVLGRDFPTAPPKAYFLTRIFHPNVASGGEICVNTLKKDWKTDLGIRHILLVTINFLHLFIYKCYLFIYQFKIANLGLSLID